MGRRDGDEVMFMPIGRFATASRLSVKSLRNYDASGLLPAAFVDPHTGYRYYRVEQLARANAVRSLRVVGMPLSLIAETLDGADPEQVLMSHLAALEVQRSEIDRMAQRLQRHIHLKEYVMSSEITVRDTPASHLAAHRTSTTHQRIFEDIPAGMGTVMAALGAAGIDPIGAPFTLYFQAPDAETAGDIALCVPIPEGMNVQGAGITNIETPRGVTASILHRGSYDDMGEAYAAVSAWILARGHSIIGPVREVYLNSPAEVDEGDLLTELHFPIDGDMESS